MGKLDDVLGSLNDLKTRVDQGLSKEEAAEQTKEIVKGLAAARGQSLPFPEDGASVNGKKLSAEAQAYGDMLLIAKSAIEVRGGKADVARIRENMINMGVIDEAPMVEVQKAAEALGTASAGYGLEWIPTQFSPSMIDRVRLELKVAALHSRIPMPTNPYKAPVVSADAIAKVQGEVTDADDLTKRIKTSKPGTINLTWTAKKLATRLITSDELTEDSIVPILPWLRDQAIMALANAQEDATINGDVKAGTADAFDNDMIAAGTDHQRAAWNGYRALAKAAAKVDLGTFNVAGLRALRAALGKYGVNPANLAWVVSIAGYNKMLSLSEVLTLEKYGAQATLLSGELGRLDNIPVVVSEFVRENLSATGVNTVGGPNTKSEVLLVYRPGFAYGDRRQVTVRSREDFETEQTIIAASQRLDFQRIYDDTVVGVGYNV